MTTARTISVVVIGTGALVGAVALASRRKPGGNVEIIRPDWMGGPKAKSTPKTKAQKPPAPKAAEHTAQVVTSIPSHAVSVTAAKPAAQLAKPLAPAKAAAPPKPSLAPKAKATVLRPPAASSATPPAALPAQAGPDATAPAMRKATQAAQDLYTYATALIRAGHGERLGSKASPDETVRSAQRDMKGLVIDGIYGPKTMSRGKELLGREFPSRTSAARIAPAAARSPDQAASDLYNVLSPAALAGDVTPFGSKAHPNALVKGAQHDMGQLTTDGIYGPKTQARGTKLLFVDFPTRPKG